MTTPLRIQVAFFSYGGVVPETFDSMLNELIYCGRHANAHDVQLSYMRVSDDALISRSRSKAASQFLLNEKKDEKCDVLMMVDHDLAWRPGDLLTTCQQAAQTRGVVGGIYSKRSIGSGMASTPAASELGKEVRLGSDRLIPAQYVAGGFCAIHREALERIVAANELSRCIYTDGTPFWPFFAPMVVSRERADIETHGGPSLKEYLSEDWAFSQRVAARGSTLHLWCKPMLVHYGAMGYTMATAYAERR